MYNFEQTRVGSDCEQGREKFTIIVAGKYGNTHDHMRCFKCNKNGHFENQCSHQQETNTIGTNYDQ